MPNRLFMVRWVDRLTIFMPNLGILADSRTRPKVSGITWKDALDGFG